MGRIVWMAAQQVHKAKFVRVTADTNNPVSNYRAIR